ncbi:MAG: hypothetical protein ACYC5A_00560 [Thermoleophilia bacterium]
MSGKASGKKRNRAAQSEQHGVQQSPSEKAAGARIGQNKPAFDSESNKERLLEKLKKLNRERKGRDGEKDQ